MIPWKIIAVVALQFGSRFFNSSSAPPEPHDQTREMKEDLLRLEAELDEVRARHDEVLDALRIIDQDALRIIDQGENLNDMLWPLPSGESGERL